MFDTTLVMPMVVFVIFVFGTWYALSLISNRNSQAEDRFPEMLVGRLQVVTSCNVWRIPLAVLCRR